MADIFISYKKEDAERVLPVVEALREEGFDVWWDQRIEIGAGWRSEIHRQLTDARLVVAVWSKLSVASDWVLDEAEKGRQAGRLCPLTIDRIPPPIGFGAVQAADLVGWTGNRADPAWRHFVASLRARLAGQPALERAPGRSRRLRRMRIAIGVGGLAVAMLAAAWLSGLVDLGLGRGSLAQQSEWSRLRASRDCAAMKAYVAREPDGPFAGTARALIEASRPVTSTRWTPARQALPVTGLSQASDDRSEGAACAAARLSAERTGKENCELFKAGAGQIRGLAVTLGSPACSCREALGHWQCMVSTQAACSWEQREETTRQVCG